MFGASGDAYHITAPAEHGEGAKRAIKMALDMAGITPADVDYINAHGTSTKLNDERETEAIKAVFGDRAYTVAISSTKSMTGHLLGAAGAIELIACCKSIETSTIHPTINYEHIDPHGLNYTINKTIAKSIRYTPPIVWFRRAQCGACLVIPTLNRERSYRWCGRLAAALWRVRICGGWLVDEASRYLTDSKYLGRATHFSISAPLASQSVSG